jgi:transcriptional regulator with XRE-family HTH domain
MAAARGRAEGHRLDFGARVRRIRTDRGLSQEALAELAGLHRTYVGSVERGERNVSLDQIYRLAEGLRVPVRELFESDAAGPHAG